MIALLLVAGLVAAPAASAATPFQDIHSSGPLTDIWIGNDLSCQVAHAGNSRSEFFPATSGPGDCGTFLSETSANQAGGPTIFGPDFSNHGSTAFSSSDTPFTPVPGGQSGVTGSGTAADPYQVTTKVTAGSTQIVITEVDSYIVGNDFYTTSITLANSGNVDSSTYSGRVYHAGDCFLRAFDTGFGAVGQSNDPACTVNANNSPPSALEQFVPLTEGSHYLEANYRSVWSAVGAQADLPGTGAPVEGTSCDCTTNEDNGAAINWGFSNLNGGGTAQLFSMRTRIVDPAITATGGQSFTGNAPATVSGTVATITDSDTSTAPSDYTATVDWGDGSTPDQNATISGGNGSFSVADSHTYTAAGSYPITVTVGYASGSGNTATAVDSASIGQSPRSTPPAQPPPPPPPSPPPAPPAVVTGPPSVLSSSGAAFSGVVNPEGLVTVAHFEYGLDPKYSGGGPLVYDQSTPSGPVGSDFSAHPVTASVAGLVPHALYHVRLVASNSSGTVSGPDLTFLTAQDPAPPLPRIGQTANLEPVSGLVFIMAPPGKSPLAIGGGINGLVKGTGFIPLTEARQVPVGSQIDARAGTLRIALATGQRAHTERATLAGGLFSLAQTATGLQKGQATFSLLENAFPGAPSYTSCSAPLRSHSLLANAAAKKPLSSSVLQTLHASDSGGRFRTRGRYSAGTVRGTSWDTIDRCDGTLTIVHRGTVDVRDYKRRKTIAVHAGHQYLAQALIARTRKK